MVEGKLGSALGELTTIHRLDLPTSWLSGIQPELGLNSHQLHHSERLLGHSMLKYVRCVLNVTVIKSTSDEAVIYIFIHITVTTKSSGN